MLADNEIHRWEYPTAAICHTDLYIWVERVITKVKWLAQKHTHRLPRERDLHMGQVDQLTNHQAAELPIFRNL